MKLQVEVRDRAVPRLVVDNADLQDALAVIAGGALKCEALPKLDDSRGHVLAWVLWETKSALLAFLCLES